MGRKYDKFVKMVEHMRYRQMLPWERIGGYIDMSERTLRRVKNHERQASDEELTLYINTLEKYLK